MTALFGALALHGGLQPQDGHALLARMRSAETAFAPAADCGGLDAHCADGLALGLSSRPQTAEEAAAPGLLLEAGLRLAARCRLDNRAGLLRQLRSPPAADCSDAALILAAYRQHGLDCVQHLAGDWAFALWDESRRRLLLARDATGTSALFWWQGQGQLLFASDLRTLIGSGRVPTRPNALWLASLLTSFYDPARPADTAFDDVHGVPPGQLLRVEDGQIEARRWRRPPAPPDPLPRNSGEWQEQFRALYDDAVRQRLRRAGGMVAATLSGGLDSGSVVALAAPALAQQGQTLTAYVHTPRFAAAQPVPGRTLDEWSLAQATARHVGHVVAVPCLSESQTPLDGIPQWLHILLAPSHAAASWFWILDLVRQARAGSATVLLTGQGGNATVSYNGHGSLWPMLRSGQIEAVRQELLSEQGGGLTGLRNRLLKPALRPLRSLWRQAWARRRPGPSWAAQSLLRASLARQLGLQEQMDAAGFDSAQLRVSAAAVLDWRLAQRRGIGGAGASWSQVGEALGLDVRDPTADQRLVDFCLHVPDGVYWAQGRQRGLVRAALADRLPAAVRDSRLKGLQSSDLRERLQACGGDLLAQVEQVAGHPRVREWIDVPRLRLSAEAVLAGPPAGQPGAVGPPALLRALAAAQFLTRCP